MQLVPVCERIILSIFWPAMINAIKTLSLIVFVSIIIFSMTAGALCEELTSAPVNAEQRIIQTPLKSAEATPSTIQQEDEDSPETPVEQLAPPARDKGLKKAGRLADAVHGNISKRIINSAVWVDSFFANERSLAEENHTYVTLRYNLFLEDSSGISNDPRVDARVVLPKLEEKMHFIFSIEPDEPLGGGTAVKEDTTNSSQVIMNKPQTPVSDKRRFTTALQYFLESTENQNISIRSGLTFSGIEPVVFGAPRYRLLIPVDSWNFRFTQEVMYRTDTRWQETTRFDLERPIGSLFFRTTAEGSWFQDKPGYFYNLSLVLFQPLDRTNALNYEWISSFETEPTGKLTDTVLCVRYRYNLLSHNWIYFNIAPQCRFPSDRDHQFTPGILLSVEAVFGRSQ